jgi:hypothetical protein
MSIPEHTFYVKPWSAFCRAISAESLLDCRSWTGAGGMVIAAPDDTPDKALEAFQSAWPTLVLNLNFKAMHGNPITRLTQCPYVVIRGGTFPSFCSSFCRSASDKTNYR